MKLQAKTRLKAGTDSNTSQSQWHLFGEFHGHVVPRPDQVRARCGGPGSTALRCKVCASETSMVKAGTHPGLKAKVVATTTADPHFLPSRLVMIDCEMTGLNYERDDVIQIAALKLVREGLEYQIADDPFNIFIHTDLEPTSDFARQYMADIYRQANESQNSYEDARALLDTWLGDWRGKVSPTGDCVPTDIAFLRWKNVIDTSYYDGDTPVDGTFFYEYWDANPIKAIARARVGRKFDKDLPKDPGDHDALVDCRNQLRELNAFLWELLSDTDIQRRTD